MLPNHDEASRWLEASTVFLVQRKKLRIPRKKAPFIKKRKKEGSCTGAEREGLPTGGLCKPRAPAETADADRKRRDQPPDLMDHSVIASEEKKTLEKK